MAVLAISVGFRGIISQILIGKYTFCLKRDLNQHCAMNGNRDSNPKNSAIFYKNGYFSQKYWV